MSPAAGAVPDASCGAAEEWDDVACALCGSEERRTNFEDGRFRIVTCGECDLTYVTPRLRDAALIRHVYGDDYWSSPSAKDRGYTDYRADGPLYRRTYRLRKRLLDRHLPRPGRVLDVGCAAGFFLEVMAEDGWDVHGLEPSASIQATAAESLGEDRIRTGTLETAGFEPGSFDLVTMWDVLEHLPDPLGGLHAARKLLRPGGALLVETQNVRSLAARVLGRRWQHYKHLEHLFHFHPGTLRRALEGEGLRIVAETARYGGKYVSPRFIAERAGKVHPLLAALFSPLSLFTAGGIYVNLFDETIVLARTPT